MNRNEAVKSCKVSKSNVFNLSKYRHLKATHNIPNSEKLFSKFKRPARPSGSGGRIKSDKERVAEIQKQNNNYKDKK